MSNKNWKDIWMKKGMDIKKENSDEKNIFLELKRVDGFDVVGEGLSYEALYRQYMETREYLSGYEDKKIIIKSVYEVGCGGGANPFLFENDGINVGG